MRGRKLTAKERKEKIEKDIAFRRQIFKELCDHVKGGYSLDCFGPLSDVSIKMFLKTYPQEFIEEELIEAMRLGKNFWEDLGTRQANGSCLGNSRTWYYNMANRFGWSDRQHVESEHKGSVNVNVVQYTSKKAPQQDDNKE